MLPTSVHVCCSNSTQVSTFDEVWASGILTGFASVGCLCQILHQGRHSWKAGVPSYTQAHNYQFWTQESLCTYLPQPPCAG